jgi:hypothetical protein
VQSGLQTRIAFKATSKGENYLRVLDGTLRLAATRMTTRFSRRMSASRTTRSDIESNSTGVLEQKKTDGGLYRKKESLFYMTKVNHLRRR